MRRILIYNIENMGGRSNPESVYNHIKAQVDANQFAKPLPEGGATNWIHSLEIAKQDGLDATKADQLITQIRKLMQGTQNDLGALQNDYHKYGPIYSHAGHNHAYAVGGTTAAYAGPEGAYSYTQAPQTGGEYLNETSEENTSELEAKSKGVLEAAQLDFEGSFTFIAKKIGFTGTQYNAEFISTLKNWQEKNGLQVDGIIGQQVMFFAVLGLGHNTGNLETIMNGLKAKRNILEAISTSSYKELFESFKKDPEQNKKDFGTRFKSLDPRGQEINYLIAKTLFEDYKEKHPKDTTFINDLQGDADKKGEEYAKYAVEKLKEEDKKENNDKTGAKSQSKTSSAELLKTLEDKNLGLGDKIGAILSSGLGASAFVVFIGVFLFTDKIMAGSFWKKIGVLALGFVAYSLGKKDALDMLNALGDKAATVDTDAAAKSIKETASSAVAAVKEGVGKFERPAFLDGLFEGGKNASSEAYAAVQTLSNKEGAFKGNTDLINVTFKSVCQDTNFQNLSIETIKGQNGTLSDEQLKSIGFKTVDGVLKKEIIIGGDKKYITADDFNSQFLPALLEAKGEAKTMKDFVVENVDKGIQFTGELWKETTESTKIIAAGIGMVLFKLPLLGGLVAGVGLEKNLTFQQFMAELMGNNYYAGIIKEVNENIGKIKDDTLKKEVYDLFSEIGKDTNTIDDLDTLIQKASGADKKILEDLKPTLTLIVAGTLNSTLSKIADEVNGLIGNEDGLKTKLGYINQLEQKVISGEYKLSTEKQAQVMMNISKAKERILEKLGKDGTSVSSIIGLGYPSVAGVETTSHTLVLNNSKIQAEISARLNDLQTGGNGSLITEVQKILVGGDISKMIQSLESLSTTSHQNPSVIDILNLLKIAQLEDSSSIAVYSISTTSLLTDQGINALSQKLFAINKDFEVKKISFNNFALAENKGYDYDFYKSVYNKKLQEILGKAREQQMTTIAWGGEQKSVLALEQEVQSQMVGQEEREKLPTTIKELSDMLLGSASIDEVLSKYSELIGFNGFDIQSHKNTQYSLISRINKFFEPYTQVKDVSDTNLISDSSALELREISEIMLKYKLVLEGLGYNIDSGVSHIKNILSKKETPLAAAAQATATPTSNQTSEAIHSPEKEAAKGTQDKNMSQKVETLPDSPIKTMLQKNIDTGDINSNQSLIAKMEELIRVLEKDNKNPQLLEQAQKALEQIKA